MFLNPKLPSPNFILSLELETHLSLLLCTWKYTERKSRIRPQNDIRYHAETSASDSTS
jgi:hypothetical protein